MTGVTCWLCGDALHRAADEAADEYVWVGEDGHQLGLDADLRQLPDGDPYARLKALADALLAAQKASTRKASRTWLYWAMAREYSALLVRMDFGGTHHVHQPQGDVPAYEGTVPEHCGWPGWLRPSGWQCRRCGTPLALERAA